MIVINSRKMIIPEEERFVGFFGDNQYVTKEFVLQDVAEENNSYTLYLTFTDGKVVEVKLSGVVKSGMTTLTWSVQDNHIIKSGLIKAQIKVETSDKGVYYTTSDYFYACKALPFEGDISDSGYADIYDIEDKIDEFISEQFDNVHKNLVADSRKIAGIDLADDITKDELYKSLSVYPVLQLNSVPTEQTVGNKGQFAYYVTYDGITRTYHFYYCVAVIGERYIWTEFGCSDGSDGRGITKTEINSNGELVITYSDNTSNNLGVVVGKDGSDGKAPKVEVTSTEDGCTVYIEQVDGAANAVFIRNGADGAQGPQGDKGDVGETGPQGPKGDNGDDGYTPVKGVDYFTEEDKALMVAEVKSTLDDIPDYWQSELDVAVEEIRRAMESAGRNKSAFFFYSDSHWDNDSAYTARLAPVLLKYLYKKTPINTTNFGGDIVHGDGSANTDIMEYLWDWREQLRGLPNHHSVIGNHDDGNGANDRALSKEYIYSYLLAPEECPQIVQGGDFYYYIDNPCEKTRYLYLDTMYEGVSDTQLAWVKETIKSVLDDWHIVAITHAWFANDYTNYPPVISGFSDDANKLLNEFDKYNSRTGDYAECGGWVEFCIGGHYHLDYDSTSSTGIPVILVEADTIHDRGGSMPQKGTTDEASVSAIVADYTAKKISIIRIGRGENREITVTTTIVNYTNVIPLSVGTDGEIFNSGQGWADSSRIGSGGIYLGTGDSCVTGHIEIDPNIDNTIYLKNVSFDRNTENTNHGLAFFDSAFNRATMDGTKNWITPASFAGYSPVYDSEGNITEFTFTASLMSNKDVKYIAFCCGYIGNDSIITINEPIS